MSKPTSIQINIPSPCSQSWDEMRPSAQGRFCDHCQKTVIDFTTWTDAALYQYFSKDTSRTCGRFLTTQIDRPIYIPHQPQSRLYRMTIALGLTLLFTQTPHLRAQNRPPKAVQAMEGRRMDSTTNLSFGKINGRVLDNKKEPLVNAAIQVFKNGVLNGQTVTDYDGNYEIMLSLPGVYDLIAAYPGFDTAAVNRIPLSPTSSTTINFTMKVPMDKAREAYTVTYYRTGLINRDCPRPQSVNTQEIYKPLPIKIDIPKKKETRQIDPPGKKTFTREKLNQLTNYPFNLLTL